MAKKVKIERFECSLYGKLIRLLLCSTMVFKMRKTLYSKENKEVSEYKAFSIVKEYFKILREKLFWNSEKLYKLLNKIFKEITKNGIKSKRKARLTAITILKGVAIKDLGSEVAA